MKMQSLLLFLLTSWIFSGSEAVDPIVQTYGLANSSVCLRVKNPTSNMNVRWKFKEKLVVHDSRLNPAFENRFIFWKGNFSLCINKLTEADSGRYEWSSVDSGFTEVKEIHQVTVEGTVPRPVMVVTRASNLSAGPCRFAVNCSVHREWATAHCDADACEAAETTAHAFNISIVVERAAAVCRGSNHVSGNVASESVASCLGDSAGGQQEQPQKDFQLIITSAVCCVVLVGVVVSTVALRKRFQKSAARSIQSQSVESPSQEEPSVSTSTPCQAEPCYENLEQPDLAGGATWRPDSSENPAVDTIYCFPDVKASARKSTGSKDTAGQGGTTSTPTSAPAPDAQQCSEMNSVYALLQRPGGTAPPTGQNRT